MRKDNKNAQETSLLLVLKKCVCVCVIHESTIFQRVLFDVFAIKVFEEMCSRESLRKMCDNINTQTVF